MDQTLLLVIVGWRGSRHALCWIGEARRLHRPPAFHHHVRNAGSKHDGKQCSPYKEAAERQAMAKPLDLMGARRRLTVLNEVSQRVQVLRRNALLFQVSAATGRRQLRRFVFSRIGSFGSEQWGPVNGRGKAAAWVRHSGGRPNRTVLTVIARPSGCSIGGARKWDGQSRQGFGEFSLSLCRLSRCVGEQSGWQRDGWRVLF